jgi:hypothetical protein
MISLKPISFDDVEDYMDCVKELKLKLDEYGKDTLKREG